MDSFLLTSWATEPPPVDRETVALRIIMAALGAGTLYAFSRWPPIKRKTAMLSGMLFGMVRRLWGLRNLPVSLLFMSPTWRELRLRKAVMMAAADHFPQAPGESEEAFCNRIHWMIILKCGLPRVQHALAWLRSGEGLIPPREQILQVMNERVSALERDGKTLDEIFFRDEIYKNAVLLLVTIDELNGVPIDPKLVARLEAADRELARLRATPRDDSRFPGTSAR